MAHTQRRTSGARVRTRTVKPATIHIRQILCPIDFSEFSRRALAYAGATAKWYGSQLTVLHAIPDLPLAEMIPSLTIEAAQRASPKNIDHAELTGVAQLFVQHAVPAGVAFNLVLQDAPDIHREILSRAAALKADLIVMGSHGRSGFERLVLGSITEKVLRNARCPLMIVPHDARHAVAAGDVEFDHIICAVDFSDSSIAALSYALSLAEESDAHVNIVHVVEMPPEPNDVLVPRLDLDTVAKKTEAEAFERLDALIPDSARVYSQVQTSVVTGVPYQEILRLAHEQRSDFIVMGGEGRGAIDRMLFGSNTHHVVRTAPCPVLAVRTR